MQIVIDIEKKDYDMICGYSTEYIQSVFSEAEYRAVTAIRKGTPLPKGHGRLIDADFVKREWRSVLDCEVEHPRYQCTIRDVLENTPTIIEADKAEREDNEC